VIFKGSLYCFFIDEILGAYFPKCQNYCVAHRGEEKLSRQGAKNVKRHLVIFDRREKSFLDPAPSLAGSAVTDGPVDLAGYALRACARHRFADFFSLLP
jgi:hypothetical protein